MNCASPIFRVPLHRFHPLSESCRYKVLLRLFIVWYSVIKRRYAAENPTKTDDFILAIGLKPFQAAHRRMCIISEERDQRNMNASIETAPAVIRLPARTLLVLCGPAGAGKSTFAAQRFSLTNIVSSDFCRELVSDDATNQQVTRDAFDLFYFIINKRLWNGRFTVADSTALYSEARRKLLAQARRHDYFAALLIFNVTEAVAMERNQLRGRNVEAQVHPYHARLLQQTLLDAPNEGWDQIFMLGEQPDHGAIEIGGVPPPGT